jgi:hypothetical protein
MADAFERHHVAAEVRVTKMDRQGALIVGD